MTDRPDPARDFKVASDRFQQAMAAAAEKTTEAEAEATLNAAIEDYNRAVDTYNAHAEQYNREHGLTEDDDEAETLRYLVRNGDTATLEAKPSWPGEQPQDERDARAKTCAHCGYNLAGASVYTIQGIDVCAGIRACLARQAEQRTAAQSERDGDVQAVAALLDAREDGAALAELKLEFNALEARFADRIAALDARDAKGGEQQ